MQMEDAFTEMHWCESRELLSFLGGDPDTSDLPDGEQPASLRIVARGGRKGEEKIFYVCEECAQQISWLHQHLNGWIEDSRVIAAASVPAGDLAAPVPAMGQ
jgi:hypothetical protein